MKDITWGQILSVAVDEIDEDHRKLLNIFNILNHALIDEEPHAYLVAVLEELINCTAWHFSHEERLMLKYGYADIEAHKITHKELIDSARELQQKIIQPNIPITEDDVVYLERWLTEHILTDDMRLGAYLSQEM